jgi:hypothetical protein
MARSVRFLVLIATAAGLGVPLVLDWPLIIGYEGAGPLDRPPTEPHQLAEQVIEITKYLQGLATSVLGLIGFLLSQRVSTYWDRLSGPRRAMVVAGAFLCGLSICVGLFQYWAILSLSADRVVRIGLPPVLIVSIIQAAQLGLGVLMIGYTALSAIGSPSPANSRKLLAEGMGGQP